MLRRIDVWLVMILVLAALFRLVFLGKVPVSLLWDEAALGYNAYSIWETGRDEYGKWFPLVFKSFGDYKPGLYVYLAVPSVALLGLSEAAVRLPAAVMGILAVWGVYQLSGYWFLSRSVSRFSALWLAICPWHVFFSRQAWEAGVMVTLLVWGMVFWEKYLSGRGRKRDLVLGGVLLGLTLFTYQSAKLVTPIWMVVWLWLRVGFERKEDLKKWVVGLVPLVVSGVVVFIGLALGQGGRIGVMSVFSYGRAVDESMKLASEMGDVQGGWRYQLWFGDAVFFGRSILGRYLNHFSPKFLIFEGDWQNTRHGVPYMGELLIVQVVFMILGIWVTAKLKGSGRWFLWFILAVAPLPAALTRDNVQAVRSLTMVIPLAILAGVGSERWWSFVKMKGVGRKLVLLAVVIVTGFQLVYFWDSYLFHMKFYSAQESQFGYKEVISKVKDLDYKKLVFILKYGQPYIYWLFYNRISPADYQKGAKLAESEMGDVGQVESFKNVDFREIYWVVDRNLSDAVLVGDELSLPKGEVESGGGKILDDIYFPNGRLAFRIVKTGNAHE